MSAVNVWLDLVAYSHSRSPSTRKTYQWAMREFLSYAGLTPIQILEDYKVSSEKQFKAKYAGLLRSWISSLSGDCASNSVKVKLTAVRSFFKYSDLPLGFVPSGRGHVEYHNQEITKEEIVAVLGVLRPRDRAFVVVMAQSGLRPSTLCKLQVKHVLPDYQEKTVPCKVQVPEDATKGQYGSYFSFIGAESLDYLERYFRTRGKVTGENYLFTAHGSAKPLNSKSVATIFSRALTQLQETGVLTFTQKARGKPKSLRLYTLRKWFRKQAGHAGHDFVNHWMGHSLGIDEHYFSRDPEHHRKVYGEKAQPHLRLEAATPSEIEKEIEQLHRELEARDLKIRSLEQQVKDLDITDADLETLQLMLKMFKEGTLTVKP